MVPLVVVTVTCNKALWPKESVIWMLHCPAATAVTAKTVLGPFPVAGENVAIPEQFVLVALKTPAYPASVALNVEIAPETVNASDPVLKTNTPGVGAAVAIVRGMGVLTLLSTQAERIPNAIKERLVSSFFISTPTVQFCRG
jgi:hypothetical protein